MKFTLITVCYNSERTIADTIKSVHSQTYKNIEHIIVDGESTDKTLSIVKKFSNIDSNLISESDNGLYDAMNKGIHSSTGDIIGFINSDDLFSDVKAIEKVVEIFRNNKDLDGVYADLYYVDQINTDKIVRKWISGNQRKFEYGWHPGHPTLYLKRMVYEKYGLFNLDYKLAADFEIMLRFIEKHKIKLMYLPNFLVKMRLGGATNESWKNIYEQNRECIRAFKENEVKVFSLFYPFFRMVPKLFQFKK